MASSPALASGAIPVHSAILCWRNAIGDEHVVTTEAHANELAEAERATFATDQQRVHAILRPANAREAQLCLRIANEMRTSIHPTSAGKNWGYGSRVPTRDSVLLDLRRLNRITAFDEKLAYVVLEPGVTFKQLETFLRTRGSNLAPLTVGSSPHASVVANILERGFGSGGYPDRMANVCALEVVLPSGELMTTGFQGRAAFVHRYGVGPALDGLFSQSNLGIVTRMAVWLRPRPPLQDAIRFAIHADTSLSKILDALSDLRLRGLLRDTCALSSGERVFARTRPYPWAETKGRTPLPSRVLKGIPRWMGWAVSGYQSDPHRRVERKLLREALAPHAESLAFLPIDPSRPSLVDTDNPLPYWRKRETTTPRTNPDRDGCGVLMFAPVLPFDGRTITIAAKRMRQIMRVHGFDPVMQIQCLFERSVLMNAMILFDRDHRGEDEKAIDCYRALESAFVDYPPYRRTVLGAGKPNKAFDRIKRALDPNDILAPRNPQ